MPGMVIYKLAGAALLLLCGALGGRMICRDRERDLEVIEGYIALIKYIKNQIDCFNKPLDRILASCPNSILASIGASPGEGGMAELLGRSPNPPAAVAELLGGLSLELGGGYRESQLKLCDYYLGRIGAERDRLAAELPRKRRSTMTLCVCGAAALALVMF